MNAIKKIILICFLLVSITYLHYTEDAHHSLLHILHRELYFIPVVLSAFWFGKRGGLTIAVLCSILFLPRLFLMDQISDAFSLSGLLEIPMYLVIAYLIGYARDVRKTHWHAFGSLPVGPEPENRQGQGTRILVCIYNSPNASKVARYVVNTFARSGNMSITLLGFTQEPSAGAFNSHEEHEKAKTDNEQTVTEFVRDAYRDLMEGGFAQQAVTRDLIRLRKERLAPRIIEEQRRLSCDTVVVPGEKMSRTEEFVVGNIAVKLVRELDCPVVTIF